MSKKKYWYYVLVFTDDGPKYVTKVNYTERVSEWDKNEKPYEMSKTMAEDITLGLSWNGFSAVVVESLYELEGQPYRYSSGGFEWKEENEE